MANRLVDQKDLFRILPNSFYHEGFACWCKGFCVVPRALRYAVYAEHLI